MPAQDALAEVDLRFVPDLPASEVRQYLEERIKEIKAQGLEIKTVDGRLSVYATKAFARGEWLWEEEPFVWNIDNDRMMRACSGCMKPLGSLEEQYMQVKRFKQQELEESEQEEEEEEEQDEESHQEEKKEKEKAKKKEEEEKEKAKKKDEEKEKAKKKKQERKDSLPDITCYICLTPHLEAKRQACKPPHNLQLPGRAEELSGSSEWLQCRHQCGELYCSVACQEKSWEVFAHCVLCPRVNPALAELTGSKKLDHPVNVHVGLKAICQIICEAKRLQKDGVSPAEAVRRASLKYRVLTGGLWWEVADYGMGSEEHLKMATRLHQRILQAFPKESMPPSPYAPLFTLQFWGRLCGGLEMCMASLFGVSLFSRYIRDVLRHKDPAVPGMAQEALGSELFTLVGKDDDTDDPEDYHVEGRGAADLHAVINHACAATAEVAPRTGSKGFTISVKCLSPIKPGQEVTINYLPPDEGDATYARRQGFLQRQFGFKCECAKCREESRAGRLGGRAVQQSQEEIAAAIKMYKSPTGPTGLVLFGCVLDPTW
eukprot:g41154.t1